MHTLVSIYDFLSIMLTDVNNVSFNCYTAYFLEFPASVRLASYSVTALATVSSQLPLTAVMKLAPQNNGRARQSEHTEIVELLKHVVFLAKTSKCPAKIAALTVLCQRNKYI